MRIQQLLTGRTLLRAAAITLAAAALATGCASGGDSWQADGTEATDSPLNNWVILEGEPLVQELQASPAHESPEPFLRVGVIWDAESPEALELSVSADGETWSPWQTPVVHQIETGDGARSYVGELDGIESEARYYRLGPGAGAPTFVKLELLSAARAELFEEGDGSLDASELADRADPTFAVGDAIVNSRASWGARATRCGSTHTPQRVTIHHTVTPTNDTLSPEARLRQIQAYHIDVNGWCDIGYQFLLSRDGRLWEGRGAERIGSHVGGANTNNVGISFMGTHTSTPALSAQLDAAATLIRGLSRRYGFAISSSTVRGHRDFGGTACPGDSLYGQLPDIIQRAKQAQLPTGTARLQGVIYRGSNSADRIPLARVELSTGHVTTADENGVYQFTNLPARSVTITASKTGFRSSSVTRTLVSGELTWGSVSLSP